MKRRQFLQNFGIGCFSLLSPLGSKLVFAQSTPTGKLVSALKSGKRLVIVFQRGACDGLSVLPPIEDDSYFKLRPTIAIAKKDAITLQGPFGLHPALGNLSELWKSHEISFIHQFGSPDETRSHFDAQDYMESGTPGMKNTSDGFLSRALVSQAGSAAQKQTLRAIALQSSLPRMLHGDANAVSLNSVRDFKGGEGAGAQKGLMGFESLYGNAVDEVFRGVGQETFASIHLVQEKVAADNGGAVYPKGDLPRKLGEIARLFGANLGVEVAVTETGGWDTHAGQGSKEGALAKRLQELGEGLAAFRDDLTKQKLWKDTLVVVFTEFGRTAKENGTRGTDHGHGSVAMVLGGDLPARNKGGKIWHAWKEMKVENLNQGRDMLVVHDFRDLLHEALASQMGITEPAFGNIFPGHKYQRRGFIS